MKFSELKNVVDAGSSPILYGAFPKKGIIS